MYEYHIKNTVPTQCIMSFVSFPQKIAIIFLYDIKQLGLLIKALFFVDEELNFMKKFS
jgi:hypothetical protein